MSTIPVGARVRCRRELYNPHFGGTDSVPAGSVGVVSRHNLFRGKPTLEVAWELKGPFNNQTYTIEIEESDVDVVLDLTSFAALPPAETMVAIKRLLHYSWRDIGYEYSGLTSAEKAALSLVQFEALKAWITPEVGAKVRAVKTVVESGTDALGDPDAKPLGPNWIHAHTGDRGVIEYINEVRMPTVRFERGTATIVDWSEIEW